MVRLGLAVKDVPEQFIANFYVDDREILRHGGIQAGHDDVIVMHLAGMGNDWNRVGLGQGCNFTSLCDATHAIGVELDVIHRMSLQQVTKSVESEFMFTTGDRNS